MNLKNSQYQAIMRQYDLRRSQHYHLQHLRYQEICDKFPAYKQLEEELAIFYANKARSAALGRPNAMTPEEEQDYLQTIDEKKQLLLTQGGYPTDYLQLTYTCPDCHDTGFIDNGNEKCHCFKQAMVDLLYRQSNIHEVLKVENFDTFDIRYYSEVKNRRLGISPRENMQSVLAACHDFIDHFDDQHRNLLFYGDTGVGKTFLTNCIARELLNASHTVIYLTAFNLVDILQNNTFGKDDMDDTDENMFHYILDCDLLIIDDLGTELNNAFITSQLFLCINERLLARKSTIISTNLSLDELQNEYSERIFSRLVSNYEIMLILGDDIRIKKAISD